MAKRTPDTDLDLDIISYGTKIAASESDEEAIFYSRRKETGEIFWAVYGNDVCIAAAILGVLRADSKVAELITRVVDYEFPLEEDVEESSTWDYINDYISEQYLDCSSLPELMDGFGVRKDGAKKQVWEVVKDALDEYDRDVSA